MTLPIENLLQHRHLWRATDGLQAERGTLGTGFASLDDALAGGGWPADGLTEIIGDTPGVGELRLLLPALAELSQRRQRWVAWVAPPWLPYAPALAAAGVDVKRVLLIHPKHHQDLLWATEQALKSGTCSAVLSWPDPRHLRHADLRRLQLAAREGDSWGVLFRPEAAAEQPSPAELRLRLAADPECCDGGGLRLRIIKRRGGWPSEELPIRFDDLLTRRLAGPEQAAALRQLALWQPPSSSRAAPHRSIGSLGSIESRARRTAAIAAGQRAQP
ncbi:MAG: translesion DNA synthesis-associated protein ImuA [Gammaproteobacteria bacterium]|nr:translesion DNA synthesis-associated protein ImuA [Gammaproteobacteria bacterium]